MINPEDGTNGNDTTGKSGTQQRPWKTIQKQQVLWQQEILVNIKGGITYTGMTTLGAAGLLVMNNIRNGRERNPKFRKCK